MFGDRLRRLREDRGLTQSGLGAVLRVSKQTISNYENGVSAPDQESLGCLADFFNVSVDYLLGREPPQPEPPDPEIRAIRRSMEGLTEEERQDILDYIAWKRAQHQKKQQERNQKGEQDAL